MIGKKMQELRKNKKMTTAEVAEAIGIKPRTYLSYETEEREPNITIINALADFYGVSTDYLLGREPPDDPLEVMGIRVRDIDDDTFIKMYRELPDNAKRVFLDVMKRLSGAVVKEDPDYEPMKHSAVTGDLIAAAEAEKDA